MVLIMNLPQSSQCFANVLNIVIAMHAMQYNEDNNEQNIKLFKDIDAVIDEYGLNMVIKSLIGILNVYVDMSAEPLMDSSIKYVIETIPVIIDYYKNKYPINEYPERWF